MGTLPAARTYNQSHVARARTGGRRIWMPPAGWRAGDIVLVDSTNFTTLFGGTDSLKNFWHNLATMK